jgi:hypothetical protein
MFLHARPPASCARISRVGWTSSRWTSTTSSSFIKKTQQPPVTSSPPRRTAYFGLLAVAIGGAGFAAGLSFQGKKDVTYSRLAKFEAPKYGSLKDMRTVCKSAFLLKICHTKHSTGDHQNPYCARGGQHQHG